MWEKKIKHKINGKLAPIGWFGVLPVCVLFYSEERMTQKEIFPLLKSYLAKSGILFFGTEAQVKDQILLHCLANSIGSPARFDYKAGKVRHINPKM